MFSFTLAALLQDAPPSFAGSSATMVRVIAGVLALVMVVIIIFRRKDGAKKQKEEDF